MPRFKFIALLLLVPVLSSTLPAAAPHGLRWQEGEILSRKTIAPSHHNNHTRYVYRIRGGGMQYTARFDRPLSVAPYSPLTFAVSGGHLVVQDADGSELKAPILKKSEPALRH
jgi:hypothetical protein